MLNSEPIATRLTGTTTHTTHEGIRLRLDHWALVHRIVQRRLRLGTLLVLLVLEGKNFPLRSEGVLDGEDTDNTCGYFVVDDCFVIFADDVDTEFLLCD